MDSVTAIIKENLAQDTLRPELIADKLGMNTRALLYVCTGCCAGK